MQHIERTFTVARSTTIEVLPDLPYAPHAANHAVQNKDKT
jgi:hypothetical protein